MLATQGELESTIVSLNQEISTLAISISQIDLHLQPLVEALEELRGVSEYAKHNRQGGIDYLADSILDLAEAIKEKK